MNWRPGENPFPGFRPFMEEEADRFFGRRNVTYELVDRLGETSFLAVLGGSGSGKSSLVRCGLLPALHQGLLGKAGASWRVARMRPRNDPLGRLADGLVEAGLVSPDGDLPPRVVVDALLRRDSFGLADLAAHSELGPQENLLVFVDQFEELFRYRDRIRERDETDDDIRFVKLLLGAAAQTRDSIETGKPVRRRVFVLITMRTDFLGDCAGFPGLAKWINEGFFLVPSPTREERREAIEGPVALAGAEITSRLVHRFLNDTGEDPSKLPILQHALMRTWDAWQKRVRGVARDGGFAKIPVDVACDDNRLDLCDYVAAGGVDSALNNHLKFVLDSLSESEEQAAEGAFQRLTETLDDGRAIRRAAPFSEIQRVIGASASDLAGVIRAFRGEGRTFLTPPTGEPVESDTLIDISHESLIPRWDRLAGWMKREAKKAQTYDSLSDQAEKYLHPRDDDGNPIPETERKRSRWHKLRDPELQEAVNWRDSWDDVGRAQLWARPHDRGAKREHGYADAMKFLKTSEQARMGRRTLHAAIIGAVLGASGGFTNVQREAVLRQDRARIIELARVQGQDDPLEGVLMLTSLTGQEDLDGRGFAAGIELAEKPIPTTQAPVPGELLWLDVPPDGDRALVVADDPTTGRTVRVVSLIDGSHVGLGDDLAPEDRALLRAGVVSEEGGILIFEEPEHLTVAGVPSRVSRSVVPGEGGAVPASFSATDQLASGWIAMTIPPGASFPMLSADRDGFVATYPRAGPGEPGLVCVWSLAAVSDGATTACSGRGRLEQADVTQAEFSDNGDFVVAWGFTQVKIWRVADGDSIAPSISNPYRILDAHYDAARNRLVVGHRVGATVWQGETLSAQGDPCVIPHESAVQHVLPAGDRLWTVSERGMARLWTLLPDECPAAADQAFPVVGRGQFVREASLMSNGRLLRIVTDDGLVSVLCASSSASDPRCSGPERRVLGAERLVLRGHAGRGTEARSLLPNDNRSAALALLTADAQGGVRIWDMEGTQWHRRVSKSDDAAFEVTAITLVRGTEEVAVAHEQWADPDAPLAVVRVHANDDSVVALTHDEPIYSLATDPTGRWLAAGAGTNLLLVDLAAIRAGDDASIVETSHATGLIAVGFDGADQVVSVATDEIRFTDLASGESQSLALSDRAAVADIAPSGRVLIATELERRAGVNETRLLMVTRVGEIPLLSVRERISDVALSPDGQHVAAVGADVRWAGSLDRALGTWQFSTLPERVISIRFFSDTTLFVALNEGGVQARHVRGDERLYAFHGGLQALELAVDAPTGRVMTLTQSETLEARVWPLEWSGLVSNLRIATRACLSEQSRELLGRAARIANEGDQCRGEGP